MKKQSDFLALRTAGRARHKTSLTRRLTLRRQLAERALRERLDLEREKEAAREALRQSEARLRQITDNMLDVVSHIAPGGAYLYVSPSHLPLLGYSTEALIGKCAYDFVHPDDVSRLRAAAREGIAARSSPRVEYRCRHADGHYLWLESTASLFFDSDGCFTGAVLASHDITKQRVAIEELKRQVDQHRALYAMSEAVSRAQAVEDVYEEALGGLRRGLGADRASIMLTDNMGAMRFKAWMGLSEGYRRVVDGHSPWALDARDPQPLLVCDVARELIGYPIQANMLAEGIGALAYMPLLYGGRLLGRFMVYFDSPHQFASEEVRLAQSIANYIAFTIEHKRGETAERQQRLLAEALRDTAAALTSTLSLEEVLDRILANLERVLEHDVADVLLVDGSDVHSMRSRGYDRRGIRPEDRGSRCKVADFYTLRVLYETKAALAIADTCECPSWVSQPSWAWVGSYAGAPVVLHGTVIGFVSVESACRGFYAQEDAERLQAFADQAAIAIENARLFESVQQERALLEERVALRTLELTEANDELARAGHLKDEFLATMSHELRTPLNAILGMSEALQEGVYGPLTERQARSVGIVESSGQHLLALINDLLDVSRIAAGKLALQMETVSVQEACQASLELVRQDAARKGLRLTSTWDGRVTTMQADPRRLKQILVNLLSNAVKFTPDGGTVGLDVTTDPRAGTLAFAVWDTGIGIAADALGRIFEPFTQLDTSLARSQGGTGLGLSLVRRMAELHGGRVVVESEPGQGSRFTVTLPWQCEPPEGQDGQPASSARAEPEPKADTSAASAASATSPAVLAASTGPLILLADDNEAGSTAITDYLEVKGYRVITASDGRQAVARAHETRPDLILMDVQMPHMDGLEATRRIRLDADLAGVPIIALTAFAMPSDVERCLAAGANYYLSKPVGLQQLLASIEQALGDRDLHRAGPQTSG